MRRKIKTEDISYIYKGLEENNLQQYERMGYAEFMQGQNFFPKPDKVEELTHKLNIVKYSNDTMKVTYVNFRDKMIELYFKKGEYERVGQNQD